MKQWIDRIKKTYSNTHSHTITQIHTYQQIRNTYTQPHTNAHTHKHTQTHNKISMFTQMNFLHFYIYKDLPFKTANIAYGFFRNKSSLMQKLEHLPNLGIIFNNSSLQTAYYIVLLKFRSVSMCSEILFRGEGKDSLNKYQAIGIF